MSTIVGRDEMDFVSLISYFLRQNGQALEGIHRRRAIVLCTLWAFIFIGGFENRGLVMLLNKAKGI